MVVAGYRIEALVGRGSMGSVYSALDPRLERRVALKVITPELAQDERFRERFLRESRLAAGLEHPHIVPIHAAGEDDGVLYLAMRYVDGSDLAALLDRLGRLDPARAVALVGQVGAALDAAHARDLVHRDVKPANILLARHAGVDHAYLCDFGLAKHASTVSSLTGSRAIVGTVDYLAPEQIEGLPVDSRADVYSLGCVLYECIAGEPPFRRENELAALLAHVGDRVPAISERRSGTPSVLDEVFATALAKDREQRFSTCGELVEAARTALAGGQPALPEEPRAGTAAALRTFVFADVRGYTSFTRELGDEAAAGLAVRFAELVRALAPEYDGVLQEVRGDEALVVFASARQALRFALALQERVADELPRPVGVGLDAGEAVPVEGGFRGGALNRAARLCALAKAGEVLASDSVVDVAGAAEGVRYGLRRLERLKGFERPVRTVEVHSAASAPTREIGRRLRRTVVGTRPRLRAALVALAAAGALAVTLPLALLTRGDNAGTATFEKDTVALLDATTLAPVGALESVGAPDGIWPDPSGRLYAIDLEGRSMAIIDPKSRAVTKRIGLVGINPGYYTIADSDLWVGDQDSATVARYDPRYGTLTARVRLPSRGLEFPDITNGIAAGAGSVWVAFGKYPFRIARIDLRSNRVTRTIDLPRAQGQALLAFGAGSLWAVSQDTGRFWRIDPDTNSVAASGKLHGGWVEDIAVVGGYAWFPVENDRAVWKVDSGGNVLKSITTGDLPYVLGHTARTLYVANSKAGTLSRIDVETDRVLTVRVGHRPQSAAVAGGLVWVSLAESPGDAREGLDTAGTLRMVTEGDPWFSTDPALAQDPRQLQLQNAIGARLLRFPDVAQPQGATLERELAEMPVVSRAGRTYTFRIRPGFAFSPPSDAQVTAEAMRYTIERALSPRITDPQAQASNLVADIAGLQTYRDGKTAHVSGIQVDGDRLAITLVKPAPDFPARISLPYFSAVPLGTPIEAHGVPEPIPSAGPYYVSSHIGEQEVLKRNPNYGGSRPQRLEAIVAENGLASQAGAAAVAAGRADYVADAAPPGENTAALAPGGGLARKFGPGSPAARGDRQRWFQPASSAVNSVIFNTRSGPFRDRRLRRAINYALDRPALAAAVAGMPWDGLISPGIPGASTRPLYPRDAPNLARARALARSTGRPHIRVVADNAEFCPTCPQVNAILRRNLEAIGLHVDLKLSDRGLEEVLKPGASWDLLVFRWYMDYADPSDFVNVLFDPVPLSFGYPLPLKAYRDPRFVSRIRQAYRTGGPARAAAYRNAVSEMMRVSPPAAVYSVPPGPAQLFSDRIGCQTFRPQDAGLVDLAALCIRGDA